MTDTVVDADRVPELPPPPPAPPARRSPFIVHLDGDEYDAALAGLAVWVQHLLLPIYGREVTSGTPWCPRWWEHAEAIAVLHGLWLAWQELTGPGGGLSGPASWHRDHLNPVMTSLRDPAGPFAGCKTGVHRAKDGPEVEDYFAE
ncbi:DUF4913 domain-containing protein [Micromonospora sp. WMMD980]|uniref:DUF4913 domain-containing protein n=1 Tax=Micromonospora sp. WMMD980 TaxID=3016088 RepID=UPI0024172D86|nr:DUF4913 domain-containing protein [Micromonospora sp. WMMD980]MDG4803269.1 DUF4913 domain-containing protein [Micromonospora sp. WMMD980]